LSKSLQEQLLKAGMVSAKQFKQAKASKAKKKKQNAANKGESNPSQQEAQHKVAEKRQRDRVLNLKIVEEKKQLATAAQVRLLIQQNKVAEDSDGQPFHFEYEGSIKSVFVSETVRKDLADGRLAIAKRNARYRIVPASTAEKIRNLNPSSLVLFGKSENSSEKEAIDPAYADYTVPDDLVW
jgi:uncharacterized protein YaiL (DUF2058 family)